MLSPVVTSTSCNKTPTASVPNADAVKAVVAMAQETSTEIVKPENIRKRIISAINTKKSYFGYKWKMVKKGEDINV